MTTCSTEQYTEVQLLETSKEVKAEWLNDFSAGAVYQVQSFFADNNITLDILNQATDLYKLFKMPDGTGALWILYEGCTSGFVGMTSENLVKFMSALLGTPI